VVDVVGSFDGRVMTVKGRWKALAFWFIEGQPKTQQWRCYSRMRDIELAHYRLNRVQLPELGEVSAPHRPAVGVHRRDP
jgi:hypothetical protein